MNAILLAIGNELVNGSVVDTNSACLANALASMGIDTIAHWTLSDDFDAGVDAFDCAARQADIVIATGGLGPTPDDLTRAALAKAMGCEVIRDPATLAEVEAFFAQRGWPMSEANACQADRPADATSIPNAMGTAPGLRATLHGAIVYCLPGVPHEMKAMFDSAVVPDLPTPPGVISRSAVHTCGMSESAIGKALSDMIAVHGDVRVGTTATAGMISIRLQVHSQTPDAAQAVLDGLIATIHDRLGEAVFGRDEDTLPSVIGAMLRNTAQTLATAESCTGGLIGKQLTDASGASEYYLGGVVAYDNQIKEDLLGVPRELLASHGAVSEPVAGAMATGVRQRLGATWAISTTGIAGPTGGTPAKPVGTVCFGLAGPDGVTTHTQQLHGTREYIRTRATIVALNLLRQRLIAAQV
jgi:nicotinamide-nucleotide amidase